MIDESYIPWNSYLLINRRLKINNHHFMLIRYDGRWYIQHNHFFKGNSSHTTTPVNPIPWFINRIKAKWIRYSYPKFMWCDACGEDKAIWVIKNPNMLSLKEKKPWIVCNRCARFCDIFISKKKIVTWTAKIQRSVVDNEGKTWKIRT